MPSTKGESSISLDIDDSQLKLFMRVAPKVLNQEFNRGLKTTMGAFTRRVAARSFGKGKSKITVRRKGRFRKKTGGLFIPAEMRKFGFHGGVRGKKALNGKFAEVKNSAKFAIAHEYGATITPKRGKYLVIRIKKGGLAAARRAGVQIPRGKKPRIIKVKKVVIPARLRFHRTFRAFRWEAITRMQKTLARAAKRAIQKAEKAKAKKK